MKNLTLPILLLVSIISFAQKTIPDKIKMCELLKEMANDDQQYRKGAILKSFGVKKSTYSQREIDSVWTLQKNLDNTNTEKLIELTNKYGWISDERIDCPKLNIWLVFRHSQNKYFDEIRTLIDKEHNALRLKDFHYKLIKNHIDGRPNMFE